MPRKPPTRTPLHQYLQENGTRPTARKLGRDPSWLHRVANQERQVYVVEAYRKMYLEEVKQL